MYKAKLRESGDIVAVKVQRPGVLEGICRDLYLFRSGARIVQSIPNVRSNLVALLDNWASRFFDELDYVREVYLIHIGLSSTFTNFAGCMCLVSSCLLIQCVCVLVR